MTTKSKPITTLPHLELMQEENLDLTNKSTLSEPLKKAIKGLNLKWNRVKLNPEKLLASQNQLAAESAELAQAIEDEIFNNIPYKDEVPAAPEEQPPVEELAPEQEPVIEVPIIEPPIAEEQPPVEETKPEPAPGKTWHGLNAEKVHELETFITANTDSDGRIYCDLVYKHIPDAPFCVKLNKMTLNRVGIMIPYYQVTLV